MAICVYESGNTTIRHAGESLTDCPGYVLLEYSEYQSVISNQLLPDLSIADATEIAVEVFTLFALAWLWNKVEQVT